MTYLEEIVQRQVATSLTATFSRTIDRIAEEMAKEIMRDPAFRAEMQTLVQQVFKQTWAEMGRDRAPSVPPDDA